MIFRVYLRSHAPNETGRVDLDSKTNTSNPEAAVQAYRALLGRDDLIGEPLAAVLSTDRSAKYFSRFDRGIGRGRIHPDAPLDPFRKDNGTAEATAWRPEASLVRDWEADPRALADCLKEWHGRPGWSRQRATDELRIAKSTYDGWCAGKAGRERAYNPADDDADRSRRRGHQVNVFPALKDGDFS